MARIRPGLKESDLTGKGRTQRVSLPRQMAMYVLRELTDLSLEEIGRMFGKRDHTTVLYAVTKMKERLREAGIDPSTLFEDLEIYSRRPSIDQPLDREAHPGECFLGDIRIFPTTFGGMDHFGKLSRIYGERVRYGLAIDPTLRQPINSPTALGFYFVQDIASEIDMKNHAPLLGTINRLSLEEALSIQPLD